MKLRFVFILLLYFSRVGFSQENEAVLPGSAIIRMLYTTDELNEISATDPHKLDVLHYYFTASYILQPLKCEDCETTDPAYFDIRKYEHLRKATSRRVKQDPKHGFTIILLSKEELEYKLPIHSPQIPAEDEGN